MRATAERGAVGDGHSGEGTPCGLCFVAHLSHPGPPSRDEGGTPAGLLAAAASYRALGWPVTLRHNQVLLTLGDDAVALIIPSTPATQATVLLATQGSPAPLLAHPRIPGHRIVLAGEPFGVPLPWPDEIHTATGHLPLPPTCTPAGPVTWANLPADHALTSCREIDLFSAIRSLITGRSE